jgi:hypothetical protein
MLQIAKHSIAYIPKNIVRKHRTGVLLLMIIAIIITFITGVGLIKGCKHLLIYPYLHMHAKVLKSRKESS